MNIDNFHQVVKPKMFLFDSGVTAPLEIGKFCHNSYFDEKLFPKEYLHFREIWH